MKPITHPLAIAFVEERARGRSGQATRDWVNANCPLYAAPTPLPAPALAMRVWAIGGYDGTTWLWEPVTIDQVQPGAKWSDYVKSVDAIDIITDYRTGEVLWRRQ